MRFVPALKYRILTPFYDSFLGFWLPEKRIRQKTIEIAQLEEKERVLDFGSGTGSLLLEIAQTYKTAKLIGVDIDPMIMSIAKKKDVYQKVDWQTTVESEGRKASFDLVFVTWVFHHFNNEEKLLYLKKLKSCLSNKGRLVIVDWGKPSNILMKLLFFVVQVLDNFKTFETHRKGTFPDFFKLAGFMMYEEKASQNTWFGTLKYWVLKTSN